MYPSDQPDHRAATGSSTGWNIALGALIAIALFLLFGLAVGIGYWWGYRSAANQNTQVQVNTQAPTPTQSPTPMPTPSPSPTPTDITGKYKNSSGEVEISDVAEKSFSFSVGVGNSGGSGSIDGKAVRNTPTVATFLQAPDESVYNDPESIYYKKKCKLTFRFSDGKVRVSEDDYACSYWHGAQIDFNGTFVIAKKK
ncbi:MAG: hypothetical protein ABJB40_05000 [Acidobacteriota bacterium]